MNTLENMFPMPNPADFSNEKDFEKAMQEYRRMMKTQGMDVAKMQSNKNKKFMI